MLLLLIFLFDFVVLNLSVNTTSYGADRHLHNNYSSKIIKLYKKYCQLFDSNFSCIFIRLLFYFQSNTYSNGNFLNAQIKSLFNDPDIYQQWYFIKPQEWITYLSHDLDRLWALNITGKGVNIGIVDHGLDGRHKDLKQNYNQYYSYNFLNKSDEIYLSTVDRPTTSSGLISSVANNNLCGVGAAPSSKFSSLQILYSVNDNIKDLILSKAILFRNQHIHIYLLNWITDFYKSIKMIPKAFTSNALIKGYNKGRNDLGSVFIAGSGSYRMLGNNCAFNGLVQRREVLVFGSITYFGSAPHYSERCNAILAVSLSSEDHMSGMDIYSTSLGDQCRNSTWGSYASSSISAGIIALLLSENPILTVRQITIAIIISSAQYDRNAIKNSAGYYYSDSFGFGMLNAFELISLSKTDLILEITDEHECSTLTFLRRHFIRRMQINKFYFYTSGCLNSEFCVTKIEQVFVTFTITCSERNTISLYLTSPSGTKFKILQPRYFDKSKTGFQTWSLKLLGYFGERPLGVWKLEVETEKRSAILSMFKLTFFGTCHHPLTNLFSHTNVINHVCKNKKKNMTDFLNKLCNPSTYHFDPELSRDICSFTESEYPYINILNGLI